MNTIYDRLPAPLQNLAFSGYGLYLQRTKFSDRFKQYVALAEERDSWSPDDIAAYRDGQLQRYVQHCAETVPFYARWFRDKGLSPKEFSTVDDMRHLPILSKDNLKALQDELTSTAVPRAQQYICHTSGSTGAGLVFPSTLDAVQQQRAIWWRYRRRHGLSLTTWCAWFGGFSVVPRRQLKPPFWRVNYPGRQVFFSGHHMSPRNLPYYVDELRRLQLPWLQGYPSLLAHLAAFLLERGQTIGYPVRWVTLMSENVMPHQISLMTRAFGVVPRQHYGMTEGAANFSECEYGRMHVDEDYSAVEFIPAEDGSSRVIGTGFSNRAFALLRYDVGDRVRLARGACECGRAGRIVESIDGRQEDYVILHDGTRVSALNHIFMDMTSIREAQIYQSRVGEIVIRVVRNEHFRDQDEQRLLREARSRLGSDTAIAVTYCDSLERTKTGKLRVVVSELDKGKITELGTQSMAT